jgi:hypothetical protein
MAPPEGETCAPSRGVIRVCLDRQSLVLEHLLEQFTPISLKINQHSSNAITAGIQLTNILVFISRLP